MARRDYFYDPQAPKPNSIRPATAVALFNSAGELLLLHTFWKWIGSVAVFLFLASAALLLPRDRSGLSRSRMKSRLARSIHDS